MARLCCQAKFWLVLMILAATFLFSGVIYGWTGMLLILRDQGVYGDLTPARRTEKFDLIMTVASVATAGSGIFIGFFLDALGPRYTAGLSGLLTIAGCFVFGWEISLTAGYVLFAVGGMGVLISSFRAAYLFPSHQSLVIGSISCLFDSSTVIFVVFQMLNEAFHIDLKMLCVGFAAVALVVHGLVFMLWSLNPGFDRMPASGGSKSTSSDEVERLLGDVVADTETGATSAPGPAAGLANGAGHGDTPGSPFLAKSSGGGGSEEDEEGRGGRRRRRRPLVASLPFRAQLRTPEFWFIYTFCIIMMFRSNQFLGTAGQFLKSLDDEAHNNLYTKFLATIVPLGFIFVPVISYFLDRCGFAASAYMVVALGLLYGGLSMVPILQVQVGTAFAFTFYRAALFSFVGAYVAKVFGPASVGRITGILYTTTAVLVLLQYPLTALTWDTFNGNYFPLHTLLTVLCLLCVFNVCIVQCRSDEVGIPEALEDDEDEDDDSETGGVLKHGSVNRPKMPASPRLTRSGSQLGLPRSWSMGSEQQFIEAGAIMGSPQMEASGRQLSTGSRGGSSRRVIDPIRI